MACSGIVTGGGGCRLFRAGRGLWVQAASAGVYSRPHNAASPHNPQHVSRVRAAVGRGSQAQASIAARTMPAPPAFLPPCPVCRVRAGSAAVGRAQAPFARQHQPQPAPAQTAASPRPPLSVVSLTVSSIISPQCHPPQRSVVGVFHVEHYICKVRLHL